MKTKSIVLSNGVTVINVENKNSLTAFVQFIFRAGAKHETENNIGVAHFLEHMLFQGTQTRSAMDISLLASSLAMDLNAETGFSNTKYQVDCLSEDVPKAFEILSDMMQNSIFDEKEIRKEKRVILEEKRTFLEDDQQKDIILFDTTSYADKYLEYDVIGRIKDIKKINREMLLSFYNKFYTSSNLIVVTTGGISIEETIELIERHLTSLPIGEINPNPLRNYKGGTFLGRKTKKSCNIRLGFNVDNNADFFACKLLNIILGGQASSRLYFNLREKKGLVYDTSSMFMATKPSMFVVEAIACSENIPAVIDGVCEELRLLKTTLVSDNDLAWAKKNYLANIARGFESCNIVSCIVSGYFLTTGKIFDIEEITKSINAISKEDIRVAANKAFNDKLTYFINAQVKNKPSYDEVCNMLNG
ncbi:MAG: pitrilysin family protein [Alphaproteobacteria bacterium]